MVPQRLERSSRTWSAPSPERIFGQTSSNFWSTHMEKAGSEQKKPNLPLWLLAEVSYKCPLHCVFCSNPVDYATYGDELSTEDWLRVLRQGRALGATQLGLSGGEPLTRTDLEILVAEARKLGYY